MALCIRQRRDTNEPDATTAGTDWTDQLKKQFETTFNEENLNKAKEQLATFGEKVKVS